MGCELELFLDIPDNSPRRVYMAREIAAICSAECLSGIGAAKYPVPDPPLAWLDVRGGSAEARNKGDGWVGCGDLNSRLSTAVCQPQQPYYM